MDVTNRADDLYRKIFDSTGAAQFVFDEEGTIVMANRAFEQLSGLNRMEIDGKKRWPVFVNPEDLGQILSSHEDLKGDAIGGRIRYEFRFMCKEGPAMPVLMTIENIEGTTWRVATLQDMASLRRLREALREKEEALRVLEEKLSVSAMHSDESRGPLYINPEDKVRHEPQWFESQKLEAIGTLADGIAHEFNNILMDIQGYVSLMHFQKGGKSLHDEKLQNIEQLIEKGANLTKQLLGFAQSGMYEVCPTDLNQLLKDSAEMFGRTKREIRIHAHFEQNLRTVSADRAQLDQVFMNLYINAWQAMPAGGDLYLETRNVILSEEDTAPFGIRIGPYVEIMIRDTGVGMDESTRLRIFEPFFTTKEMGRGTGLELAFVYGVIKNHGGMVRICSEKGQGTTFMIYFPAADEEPSVQENPKKEVAGGMETILVVDDEEINIDVMQEWLEILGYKVLTAKSGQEAVEIYQQQGDGINLVILDMVMPGMNGGEVFDVMKTIRPEVKAILSSGYSIDGKAKEIMQRGVKAFIQKPFRIDSLAQKIREVLQL